MRLANLGPRLGTEPPEAAGMGLVIAQETKAGAGDRTQDILAILVVEGVLAIAKEGEIALTQPQKKAPGLGDLLGINHFRRVSLENSRDLLALGLHLGPVLDRLTHVRKDP